MTDDEPQRIARLTPLADVLAFIAETVTMVEPAAVPVRDAAGLVLAEDVVGVGPLPARALALRDGYAIRAELTLDASAYAPAPLPGPPPRLDVGDPLPETADAVAPLDAIAQRDGRWEAVAAVAPGEGILHAGADAAAGAVLREGGYPLRPADITALIAAGRREVSVHVPRVCLVRQGRTADPILDAARQLVAQLVEGAGGRLLERAGASDPDDFWSQPARRNDADFLISIGGTGGGRRDSSVHALARSGRVDAHGIAIGPGETAAFGVIRGRPVLLIPGRIDAAFAVWHLVGRPILERLSGCLAEEPVMRARLMRKISSPLGLVEVVPVTVREGTATPIASGYVPLSALVRADGWILIPADSEGFPAGAEVVIRPCA